MHLKFASDVEGKFKSRDWDWLEKAAGDDCSGSRPGE
jgi:hypothetical protein